MGKVSNRSLTKAIYRNAGNGRKGDPAVITEQTIVYPQRNKWSCGPMALRHCLFGYGFDVDDRRLAKLAGTTRSGTSDSALVKAIKKLKLGLHLSFSRRRTASGAKKLLMASLKKKRPVILCIDKWSHWVAVLYHSRRGFLMLDSSRPGPVIQFISWKKLQPLMRLKYTQNLRWHTCFMNDKRPIYDIGVLILDKACTKKRK